MYEGGIKAGARVIMRVFFALVAIVIICYFGRVVLSYINPDGTVSGSGDCSNSEGFSALDRAGVFGNLHPKCEDKKEDSDSEKDPSWRSKY
jgi:hypothetical protein